MESLFLSVWNRSIAAGWLILAVVLLRLALKKAPKSLRCLLWALVAVRLVCPFSIQSVLSLVPSAETVPQTVLERGTLQVTSGVAVFNAVVNEQLADYYESTNLPAGHTCGALLICADIWLAGAAVLCLWALVSWLKLRRQVAAAVPEGEGVWLCDEIAAPFLLGLFRPRIYLPAGLDSGSRACVLAHERAHLRRGDHWVKPIGFLLLALHWFNPLIWLAYVLLCRDIELACDERVIRELGEEGKKAYSQALLLCSVRRSAIAACPLAFGEVGIRERVKNVLNYKKPAFWVVLVSLALCAVAAVCFLTDPKADGPAPAPEGDFFTISNPLLSSTPPQWDEPDAVASMEDLFDGLTYQLVAEKSAEGLFQGLSLNLVARGENRSLLVYPNGVGKLDGVEGWVAFDDPGLYGLLQYYYCQAMGCTVYTGGQLLYELASLNFQPVDGSVYASVVEDGDCLFILDGGGKERFTGELSRTKTYTRQEFLRCFDRAAQESGGLEKLVPGTVVEVAERYYSKNDGSEAGMAIWELTFAGGGTWLWLSEGTPPMRLYELIDHREAFPYQSISGSFGGYLWTYTPGYSLPIRLEGDFSSAAVSGDPGRLQLPETLEPGRQILWSPDGAGGVLPERDTISFTFHLADGAAISDSLELRTVSKARGLYGSRTYGAAIDWLGAVSSRFHQVRLAADEGGLVLTSHPSMKLGTAQVQVQGERTAPAGVQDAPAEG